MTLSSGIYGNTMVRVSSLTHPVYIIRIVHAMLPNICLLWIDSKNKLVPEDMDNLNCPYRVFMFWCSDWSRKS